MYIKIKTYIDHCVTILMALVRSFCSMLQSESCHKKDSSGQTCSSNTQVLGVQDHGTELVIWFNNPYGWADVHYKLNGANYESFRMLAAEGNRHEKIISVTPNSPVKLIYSFTHATAVGATSTVDYVYERHFMNALDY